MVNKVFLFKQFHYTEARRGSMKTDEVKTIVNTVKEMNESYVDLIQSVKGMIKEAKSTKQLWRDGNEPRLIKLGLTLIVFPEPTPISETVGTCLLE